MATRSQAARLTDILEAIELIRAEMAGVTISAFASDRRKQWVVERGVEIISEASRRLADELKARHPSIPWPKIAGIGNLLRHEYQHVAYDAMFSLVRDNLSPLEKVCSTELSDALAKEA